MATLRRGLPQGHRFGPPLGAGAANGFDAILWSPVGVHHSAHVRPSVVGALLPWRGRSYSRDPCFGNWLHPICIELHVLFLMSRVDDWRRCWWASSYIRGVSCMERAGRNSGK